MADNEDGKKEEQAAQESTGHNEQHKAGSTPMMPEVTFATFVLSLGSSALMHLGEVPEPESGKPQENLMLAKHTIDILSMLQEKIEKGLDGEEKELLQGILYEVRMKYVMKK